MLRQFFYYTEIYHRFYRKSIAKFIYSNETIPNKQYINELKFTSNFADQFVIINAAICFNCNIVIYTNHNYNEEDYNFNFQCETAISPQDILNPFIPIILLGLVNDNHFILLFPKDLPDNFIKNVNKKIKH